MAKKPEHIHVGTLDFLSFAAYAVIFGAFWRTVTAKLAASEKQSSQTLAKAMGWIF